MEDKELFPHDGLYKTINFKVTLDDEGSMLYSVFCPEWVYSMPSSKPDEILWTIMNAIVNHNQAVKSGGVSTINMPLNMED